jgi:hypothetical protein
MTQPDLSEAPPPDSASMLAAWEEGNGRSPTWQGLVLLGGGGEGATADRQAALPIGRRDAALLARYRQLFGSAVECLAACPQCEALMEIGFDTADIRIDAAPPPAFEVEADGTRLVVRLPDSRYLLAIERIDDPARARRALIERCIVEARDARGAVAPAALPDEALDAVEAAAGEADPQAEIVVRMACPSCAATAALPFDIVRHAWARLDHWAKAMLKAVDALAVRYGWSEADILALSPSRRQLYLDLAARTAG